MIAPDASVGKGQQKNQSPQDGTGIAPATQ
jgi:hypothetical protein